jgi:hypothetical protein
MSLTLTEAFLIGAAAILALLAIVEAIARIGHASFLTSVILGEDNRTSTSKTFVFMWTLLVGWALTSMLIVGELIKIHSCAAQPAAANAAAACVANKDQVGLLQIGWQHFIASGLSGGYLVLLGIPATAAVAAKAITQSKNDSGTMPKVTAPGNQSISSRAAQIFSSDDNTADIGDFQYMVFNLVTAVYFVAQFVQPNGQGLPAIPNTLLGLTSVSAALYVGKKAATRTQPVITGAFPSILRVGQPVTITGSSLTTDPTTKRVPPGAIAPQVTINGIPALNVTPDPAVADRLTATVPPGLVPGPAPVPGTIQVLSAYGSITPGFAVQLSD